MRFTLFIILSILFSCQGGNKHGENTSPNTSVNRNKSKSFKNFEERMSYEVMEKLSISSNEKFTLKIYKEHLNNDDRMDAVLIVNRLEFAMNEAAKSKNAAKRAELGYLGSFNHFFFFDGALDELSFPVVVPSSAKAPLEAYFEHIQSENYKDLIIKYRIRNAAFRNYYVIHDQSLQLVFQWKEFDQIGQTEYIANFFDYGDGTFCLVKDILIYKGKIKNYSSNIEDIYKYNNEILKTNRLEYRFMFDPKIGKYVTKAKPKNEL